MCIFPEKLPCADIFEQISMLLLIMISRILIFATFAFLYLFVVVRLEVHADVSWTFCCCSESLLFLTCLTQAAFFQINFKTNKKTKQKSMSSLFLRTSLSALYFYDPWSQSYEITFVMWRTIEEFKSKMLYLRPKLLDRIDSWLVFWKKNICCTCTGTIKFTVGVTPYF